MNKIQLGIMLVLLAGFAFAQTTGTTGTAALKGALSELCTFFNSILPIGVMIAIVLAGLIFAVGQTMGAETRARANVWATNLVIGAIIAGVVVVLAPTIVSSLVGGASCSGT